MRFTLRTAAAVLVSVSLIAACGGSDDKADDAADPATSDADATPTSDAPAGTDSSTGTDSPMGTDAPMSTDDSDDSNDSGSGWTAPTEDCVDPDKANEPIEGTVKIGMFAALSGGPVVAAFQPVIDGYKAYIEYANQEGLVADHELELIIGDDQYNPSQTPDVVNGLLDDGVQLIGGGIGTANGLAVRGLLGEECVPQLAGVTGAEEFGDAEDYPWTMSGINLTYPIEAKAYALRIADTFPDNPTVGVFYVNTELGLSYYDGFVEAADELGIEIVATQTIEQADSAPPTAQLNEIARETPDAIFGVPVGGNCPQFLTELANAKAANDGWEPDLYVTSTCSSPPILDVAGDAADEMYTATPGVLITEDSDIPAVQDFTVAAESVGLNPGLYEAAGWTIGEIVVETLNQAAATGELTQATIMEAARSMDFQPTLYRDGVVYRTNGVEDGLGLESVQVVQYDVATRSFTDVGDLVDQFES